MELVNAPNANVGDTATISGTLYTVNSLTNGNGKSLYYKGYKYVW